jgi:ABC-2 type transport system permease protein
MSTSAEPSVPLAGRPLTRPSMLSPLTTLFWLTLRQNARGWRLRWLIVLFTLPMGLALLLRSFAHAPTGLELEFALVFLLIPHTLAPLTALLYASGMIQDEIEEQTLTYLLMRPIPRWALYIIKLLATWVTTTLLTIAGVAALYLAIYWGTPELWDTILPLRLPRVMVILALAQAAYCTLFATFMLMTRWSLLGGVIYIFAVEGIMANVDFLVRKLTVIYYGRVLVLRWLDLPEATVREWGHDWQLDLTRVPEVGQCLYTLVGAVLVIAILSAWRFSRREFALKTPEGS